MPKGSCVCGEWTYEYEGEPEGVAVCHCVPCRKTAGSNGSYNIIVQENKFKKLSGTDKPYDRLGESGKNVKMTFCANCNVYMTVDAEALAGVKIVKGGTLDDEVAEKAAKPQQEIFTRNRPEWCAPHQSAIQKEGQ